MAVSLQPNNIENAKIEIYKIEESKFKPVHVIRNILSKILFVDFSINDCFLLFREEINKSSIFDVVNLKNVNENDL